MAIPGRALARLKSRLEGDLLLPESDGYDEHRRSFNALIDRRPAGIAACATVDDVRSAVTFGVEHGIELGVRGGGHSVSGHGLVDGGLVIDLRRMQQVVVDAYARRASAEGGAQWLHLDTAAQAEGLGVTGGTFVDTGVAGLTLGGGIGFLLGICGLTCDNLVGVRLVTADGTVREIDGASDPDLLWALRGGGGNFGVATRLDLALRPVGELYGGSVLFALEKGEVIRRLRDLQREAPDTFVALAYIAHRESWGPSVSIQVAALDHDVGRSLAGELMAGTTVLDGEYEQLSYMDQQAIAEILPFGLRHYWKSAFVAELSDEIVATIVALVESRPQGKTGILLEPIHGQARRHGFDHSPFPQRTARYHVSGLGIWTDPATDRAEIDWVRDAHARVRALGTSGAYQNYMAPDEPGDAARQVYPAEVLARLREVKRRVDPANVFRANLNILPAD